MGRRNPTEGKSLGPRDQGDASLSHVVAGRSGRLPAGTADGAAPAPDASSRTVEPASPTTDPVQDLPKASKGASPAAAVGQRSGKGHATNGSSGASVAIAPVDLRPRRDLFNRRRLRERARGTVRVLTLVVGDIVAVVLALRGAFFRFDAPGAASPSEALLTALPLAALLLVLFQAAGGTYGPGAARKKYDRAFFFAVVAAVAFAWIGHAYDVLAISLTRSAALAAFLGGLVCAARLFADEGVEWLRRRGIATSRTLIIAEPASAHAIAAHVAAMPPGQIRIAGWVAPLLAGRAEAGAEEGNGAGRPTAAAINGDRSNGYPGDPDYPANPDGAPPRLGSVSELGEVLEKHDIRSVVVSARLGVSELQGILESCLLHGCRVGVVPDTLNEVPCRITARDFLGWPLLELQIPRLHSVQTLLKRGLDLFVSFAALAALAPLFAVVALLIRLGSSGPILFRQRRLGVGGRPFTIYKFRSMRTDAEEVLRRDPALYAEYVDNDFKLPPERDPRINRLGAFLRRTSIDELPQLFNVLRGDMSLVGPRPIVPDEIEKYGKEAGVFLAVKPGVTGYWQISGRSHVGYPERARLEIEYIENWSLAEDLEILLKTVPRVFRSEGAH